MMDAAVWQSGYRIEAQETKMSALALLGGAILLLVAGGVAFTRRQQLSAKTRGVVLTGCMVSAAGMASAPWWGTASSNSHAKTVIPAVQVARSPPQVQLAPPDQAIAFEVLYRKKPQADGTVALPDGQVASWYYSKTVTTEAGLRHVVLLKTSHPEQQSFADGVSIDAVSLRPEGGRWVVDAQVKALFGLGSYGGTSAIGVKEATKVEIHALGEGATGLFLPAFQSHQGYSNDHLETMAVSAGKLSYLGHLEKSGDNGGACNEQETSGSMACYEWIGSLQVNPAQEGNFSTLTIKKTGTERVDDSIIEAKDVVYSLGSNGYEPLR